MRARGGKRLTGRCRATSSRTRHLGSSQPPTPAGRSVNILGREVVARGDGRPSGRDQWHGASVWPGGERDAIGCSIRPAPR
jgi:hypothetical protein